MVIATAIASIPIVGCFGGNCGKVLSTFGVTFVPCAADAGALPDGGVCPSTCEEACSALEPDDKAGFGVCADVDAALDPLTPGTSVTVQCNGVQDCTGRKLEGTRAPTIDGEPIAAQLASAAWLEAAAVFAFRRLARELRAHGAPARLVRAARRCARDEIRHARIMTALAKKHGAVVPRAPRAPREIRDLESIARENGIEGCVSETYGAAVAAWQAESASDPDVARAMRAIAPDELRHAALGWAVQTWIERRLDAGARARVRAARDQAAREIVAKASETAQERAIARSVAGALWAA